MISLDSKGESGVTTSWPRSLQGAVLAILLLFGGPTAHASYVSAPIVAAEDGDGAWVAKKRRKPKDPPPPPPAEEEPEQPAPAEEFGKAIPNDLPAPPPLPKRRRAIALFPLIGIDVGEGVLPDITKALMTDLNEISPKTMRGIAPADVLAAHEKFGINVGKCDGAVECLATAARYAGAHMGIETRVASLGGTLSISMRLIDARKKAEVTRVADPLSDDRDTRARETFRLAIQLLNPELYVGSLKLLTKVDGADVYLDDKLVGQTPLPGPLKKLRAGPHILRITKPGYTDINRFVDVVYDRESTIDIDQSTNTIAGVIVEQVSVTGFGSLFVLTETAGIEIRVDGEPMTSTILEVPIEKIEAGTRRISFWQGEDSITLDEVEIQPNKRTDMNLNVAPDGTMTATTLGVRDPSEPLPTEVIGATADPGLAMEVEEQGHAPLYAGIGVAGAGAVSLVLSAVFGAQVKKAEDDKRDLQMRVDAAVAMGGLTTAQRDGFLAEVDQIDDDGKRAQTLHLATFGVGAALVATGGALILWDLLRSPEPASTDVGVPNDGAAVKAIPTFTPEVGRDGARFNLGWEF